MEFDITIDLSGFEGMALKKSFESIDTLQKNAVRSMGSKTMDWIVGWYQEKGEDYFDNPESKTHGAGRQDTRWAEGMLQGWTYTSTGDTAIIGFAHPRAPGSFYYKVHGGTITAKNTRALTIPINPLAHGKKVSDIEAYLGEKLFRPYGADGKKADYLAAQIQGEGLVPMFALRKSVHIDPWPCAVPEESDIKATATYAAMKFYIDNLG